MLIALVVYFGFYKLTGLPRNPCYLATLERLNGDLVVLYNGFVPEQAINLLVQSAGQQPLYVKLPWSFPVAIQIAQASMKAKEDGSALMVHSDFLSSCHYEASGGQDQGAAEQGDAQVAKGDAKGGAQGDINGGTLMFYAAPHAADPLKNPPPVHGEIRFDGSH